MARTPIHPGEHLAEALEELGMSAAEFARQIEVPTNRVTGILNEKRAVTADTALCRSSTNSASPKPKRARRSGSCRKERRRDATPCVFLGLQIWTEASFLG
jgi:addiction module HigA family antidote